MDGKRTYSIVINGITESISEVDKLLKKLDELDARIIELEKKKINVEGKVEVATTNTTSTSSASSSRNTASLSEEAALQKEINKLKNEGVTLDAKIAATQDEVYQKVQATKDLYKEAIADQKQIAAQERLTADAYSNTMAGMKAKLADIKQVMQTVDLGDTDQFNKLTQDADKLNSKLLEIEKSYGQFGRQVGNYEIVNEGLGKVVIAVGGVEREFANAREASRELSNELKSMAINGQQDTEAFKELQKAVLTLNSDIKDATVSSKAMDNLLDTMQSFAALGNISAGFSTLFGFDDSKVEEAIKKLMALQNALKGIESINQQIKSGEFMGGMLTKANSMIDGFAAKLTGAKTAQDSLNASTSASTTTTKAASVAQKELNATNTAGATTTKALTTAQNAQTVATKGTTAATKALSLALKTIGIGLVIAAVMAAIAAWDKYIDKQNEAKKATDDSVKTYANAKGELFRYQQRVESFNGTKKEEKKIVDELNSKYGTSLGQYKSLAEWKSVLKTRGEAYCKVLAKEAEIQALLNLYTENYIKLQEAKKVQAEGGTWYNKILDDIKAPFSDNFTAQIKADEAVAKIEEEGNKILKKVEEKNSEIDKINKEYKIGDYSEQIEKGTDKTKKALEEEEKELVKLRIANMKEGLNKTITQLEEERKARLAKLNSNSKNYKELEANINKFYDKKIEEATKEHAEKVKETYKQMWESIFQMSLENESRLTEVTRRNGENLVNEMENMKNALYNQNISSYGIQGKEQYTPETQKSLGILSNSTDKMVADYKKLIDVQREYQTACNVSLKMQMQFNTRWLQLKDEVVKKEEEGNKDLKELEEFREDLTEEEYNKKREVIQKTIAIEKEKLNQFVKIRDEEFKKLTEDVARTEAEYNKQQDYINEYYTSTEERVKGELVKQKLLEESYTSSLASLFKQRINIVDGYWGGRINQEKKNAETLYKQSETLENAEYEARRRNLKSQAEALEKQANKNREEGLMDEKEEAEAIERIWKEYGEAEIQLEKQHNQNLLNLEKEKVDSIKAVNAEYYQESLQELRGFQTALSNLESKQPVYNALGIVNLKQTNKNNRELLASYESLAKELKAKRENINYDYKNGFIDEDVYKSSLRELDSFAADLGDRMDDVKHQLSFGGQWEQLSEGINNWVQMIGQGVSQIMSSLSEITQNQYQAQIDEQQKYIDKYQEMLDKQKDITQKYADDVNNIEDELKTARGDRRQQLIDNLNAEMAAQRASLAQEKKIEKEQEKAEQKKKKLEHDQAVAKKKMDLAQAFINAAMAVSMAAVNKWPVPAIPMMAMAAAATAAQIAAIQSQNIPSYGSGGLLEGKSHKEGGIKASVGRTPIELEGQEYVIRKKSTVTNLPVLDFINRSERKLNINDFIDFYSSGKVKKSIVSASPRTKFADGGMIPTLRNDIEINDRLVQAMEDYSNRPTVVSVQEIVDVNEGLNKVKVLSGLEPSNV